MADKKKDETEAEKAKRRRRRRRIWFEMARALMIGQKQGA